MPQWANLGLILIAFFVFMLGIAGYYSVTRGKSLFLQLYIIVLAFCSFMCLITGIAMILKTSTIKEIVSKEWIDI